MTPAQVVEAVKSGKIGLDVLNGFSAVRYAYFGRTKGTNTHNGVTCVGYTISDDGKILRIAIAFCSPNDVFVKNKSQAAIHGRIAWGKTEDIEATDRLFTDMRYEEIVNIIKKAVNDDYYNALGDFGCTSVKAYAETTLYKDFPSFAEVNFPWWFTGI